MNGQASSSAITSETFDEFNSQLQTLALKATRSAFALPVDVAFHRSMDSGLSEDLGAFSTRILSLTNNLLSLVATADPTHSARGKGKAKLEGEDDVVDHFDSIVVDSMDQLLEKTDMCLDLYLGRTKAPAIKINPAATTVQKAYSRGQLDPVLQHASHLQKPQLAFKRGVTNNDSPWYPSLSHKYNAQVPLGYDYRDPGVGAGASDLIKNHPYRYEIAHISYPERMFQSAAPIPTKDFADTPFTWVATPQALQTMLDKLKRAPEIAVDLEHHSYRSYAGFLCLMQISTREEDWIVDTLVLRDELTELNEVFTDPEIIKVFHGAESDILWLQQDFNLYIVNLFDTYHASKILDFPRHGLANLLEMYCDFVADKRYQRADWRIRPLPEEMLLYARSDTHFLLYIYDNLRNALLDRAQSRAQSLAPPDASPRPSSPNPSHTLIKQVLSRSEETSLRTYEKEIYDAEGGSGSGGWDTLARKWNKGSLLAGGPGVGVGALHREVFKGIHWWREKTAREEDESTKYVLPNHHLLCLAEEPPADMAGLIARFQPVPPVIRRRAKELLEVIRNCIKSHHARTEGDMASTSTSQEETTIPQEDAAMSTTKETLVTSSLWSNVPRSTNTGPRTSSLFGSTLSTASYPARKTSSTLFGEIVRSPAVRPDRVHFRELVARINSTLVIVPSAPKVAAGPVTQEPTTPDATMQIPDQGVAMEMQVEIPYVPASQRRTTAEIVEDSIVVVGQARQKKRKRTKGAAEATDQAPSAEDSAAKKTKNDRAADKTTPQEHSTPEPFDFSAVPNILDDNPNTDETKVKRKKSKQTKGGVFYGDFPAPPKAHSELKSGNQSHTFK